MCISSYVCTWQFWRAIEKRVALKLRNLISAVKTGFSHAWLACVEGGSPSLPSSLALAPALLQLFNTERGNNWSTRFLDNYLETNPTKKSVLEAKCFLKTSSYTGTIFHPLERCILPVKLFSQFPPPPPPPLRKL